MMVATQCITSFAATPEIDTLIAEHALIAWSVSGVQDSDVLVLEGNAELDCRGHTGPCVCIHSDLGVLAWASARQHRKALLRHVRLPLMAVKREKGDILARWKEPVARQARRLQREQARHTKA